MLQKIIQVGNSLAVTIPKGFTNEVGIKAGQKVMVDEDVESGVLTVQPVKQRVSTGSLTPEFLQWLKKFNARYKDALTELAKK